MKLGKKDNKELPEEKEETAEEKAEPSCEEKLKEANAEIEKWKNLYYMSYADTQNLRKSLEEDHREAVRYRASGFLEKLIPPLDCLYIALQGETQSEEAKNYRQGFQFIYNQLEEALLSEGVSYVEPKAGDTFDPHTMEAIETVESEDTEGKVVECKSKGYLLHDRLIRAARVTVSVKKEKKEEEKLDA